MKNTHDPGSVAMIPNVWLQYDTLPKYLDSDTETIAWQKPKTSGEVKE